jgi:uncharacterized protein with HEPN domain
MKDEVLAHLHDIVQAGTTVKRFIHGRSYDEYASDEQLRSAVERKFEIMGEALNRIRRDDPAALEHIRNHRDIISFRNILVHGYDTIDDLIVWGVIEDGLDSLIVDAQALLHADSQ